MHSEAIDEAVEALQRVQRTLATTLWDRLPTPDLSIRQVKALHIIGACRELTVGALGERLGIKLPAASIQADHLVQAGLLERQEDPEDRRRVKLSLTPRGAEILESRREIRVIMRQWIESMPEADVRALARGLRRLAEAASRAPDSEPEAAARIPG